MNDADMGAWSYGYDAQGNLTSQTDAKGQITLIAYDLLNRLIGKSWSGGGSVSYTWDANGDLGYRTGMSDASGETTWDFDPSGRVIAEDKVVLGQQGTTLWAYDAAGRVSTLTYPGGEEVAYTYLPQGGVNTVGNYLAGTTVNANGQKSLLSLGNGTSIAYEYLDWLTDSGRLGKMSVPGLEDLTYTYDGAGNITSITDGQNAGQVQSFGYDALDRLTSASSSAVGNGQYNQTYTYDPSTGNLSYKSDMGSYTYSPTHPHAVTSAGGNAYAYDLNGNITSRTVAGQVWTYTYDAENHLTATRRNGDLVSEYGYDGDGNRVWAKDYENGLLNPYHITVYIGDTSELSWEEGVPNQGGQTPDCSTSNCVYLPLLVRGAEPTSYYYADGTRIAMRVGREVYYLYGDQLGSTVVTTDVDGGLVSQTLYEPWGEARYQSGTGPTDYAFTGQMQEGDIYFYNARWYDPALGRFMQADSFIPTAQGTQGWDRYAYVNNNPLRYTDPSGQMIDDGCHTSGCSATLGDINRDLIMNARLSCGAGNEMHCSYAENHPVDTILSIVIGLAVVGLAGGAVEHIGLTGSVVLQQQLRFVWQRIVQSKQRIYKIQQPLSRLTRQ